MRIFLGSSGERISELHLVATWVAALGHEALSWDAPGVFPVGQYTFDVLNSIKDQVNASIFIFSEDDLLWYRGDTQLLPRDNVLVEYGLFCGALEPSRVAICRVGSAKIASDLLGVTYISLDNLERARTNLAEWCRTISETPPMIGKARLIAFENKFSMPKTDEYWKILAEDAKEVFVLLGGTNKSWIHRSPERRKSLAQSIVRVLASGGHVGILSNRRRPIVKDHIRFFKQDVISLVDQRQIPDRLALREALTERLCYATCDYLNYQAVVSDERIVIMPLLNSPNFRDESPVFELLPAQHGAHHNSYYNDILRTLRENKVRNFVRKICLR